jgi:hypothetical protein
MMLSIISLVCKTHVNMTNEKHKKDDAGLPSFTCKGNFLKSILFVPINF